MNIITQRKQDQHRQIAQAFPDNEYVHRLISHIEQMGIYFKPSPVQEQWLYKHDERAIYVWLPDLQQQSLSFLVVVLAHEIGHAIDFQNNPHHFDTCRRLQYWQVPDYIEVAAFVNGFHVIQQLAIPIDADQYEQMIEPSIAAAVREQISDVAAS